MNEQNEKNGKKYNYNFIQFTLSQKLKQKINKIIEDSHYSTMSDFVREAVQDKIRRIENPEIFESKGPGEFSQKQLRLILQNTISNAEKIDLLIEKTNTIIKIQNSLEKLRELVNKPEIEELQKKTIELLEEKGKLRVQEIAEGLSITIEKVYDIVSNDEVFELDVRSGRFGLKNE